MKMGFLFTSESVSEGHPDKVSDQISDAILDEFLRRDANSKVACETLCTTGLVVVAGEVRSEAYVDVQGVARRVINRIGYTRSDYQFDGNSCGILSAIHEQSSDINQGVVREAEEEQGAGDQGIMFGYACNETREMMPATLILSHVILKELAVIRREGEVMTYLRPDSKSQVTIEYDETTNKPLRVHTIVVSTQHDEFILSGEGRSEKEAEKQMQDKIREDVRTILIPRVKARLERAGDQLAALIGDDYILHVNPTGKFVIGGPHGDTGLTGRKIIVDTYGGRGAHGGEIARRIGKLFDLRPAAIVKRFGLKNPIFEATASYGHFGNRPYTKVEKVWENGVETEREIEFFGWEKLDAVEQIKREFGL